MAEGFSMTGSGAVAAGTIYIDIKTAVKDAVKEMQQLEKEAAKTAKNSVQQTGGLDKTFKDLRNTISTVVGAVYSMKVAWDAFYAVAKEETQKNRVEGAIRRIGLASEGLREELAQLGAEFMRSGHREEAAYKGYLLLVNATRSRTEATEMLTIAQKFARETGEDVESVVTALTMAYGGQYKQLDTLLMRTGTGAKTEMLEFNEALERMREVGNQAFTVLDEGEVAVNNLRVAWDSFADSFGMKARSVIIPTLMALEAWLSRTIDMMSATMTKDYGRMQEIMLERQIERTLPPAGPAPFTGPTLSEDWEFDKATGTWKKRKKRGPAPRPGEGEGGKFVDPYAAVREQREYVFDRMQQLEDERQESLRKEGELLLKNWQAFKEYQNELAQWNILNSPAYQGMKEMADLFGDTLVTALTEFKLSFEDIGRSVQRILAEIIRQLLLMRYVYPWIERTTGLAPGTLTGQPQKPKAQGFGGARPLGGGGAVTVQIQGTSGGMLASVWRGASLVERKQVSSAMLTTGGKTLALTA